MPGPDREVVNGRLVYYGSGDTSEAWDSHWSTLDFSEIYRDAERGDLGWIGNVIERYLQPGARVLEAGCGPGQHVVALLRRGYRAEGLEWGRETVARSKAARPDLPVTVGDVGAIPRPDGFYNGYISLGVVEHTAAGPGPYLKEAFRVLAEGGTAFISVPCFHGLRRLKGRLGFYRARGKGRSFYQYAFSRKEFARLMEEAGFRPLEVYQYDSYKGLADEIPLMRWICNRRAGRYDLGSVIQNILRKLPVIENSFGHMVMYIGTKPAKEASRV